MELFGATQYFSTEAFEHKIKQLKAVARLTNSHNPCNDIPLADFYKINEKWQITLEPNPQTTEIVGWRSTRVYDPLAPFLSKLYQWNTVTIHSGIRLQKENFVLLKDGRFAIILQIWGPKVVSSITDVYLKVLTFKDSVLVEFYPMWTYGTVDQIQLIHPHDVNKKILGIPVPKSPLLFLFDEDFRV
jgi:hypothetical protein